MMKLHRLTKAAAFSAMLATGLTYLAFSASANLSGLWRVTWAQDAKNTNELELLQTGTRITGNYVNDSKENCGVTGAIDEVGSKLALQVACKNWGIRMDGVVSADRNTVTGNYTAYLNDKGTFSMVRH